METVRIQVYGRVQGVGFRAMVARKANELGVTGWVRNRFDGTVEAILQGTAADTGYLIEWIKASPGASVVERLRCEPAGGEFDCFMQVDSA
jgi:acylphosphatase